MCSNDYPIIRLALMVHTVICHCVRLTLIRHCIDRDTIMWTYAVLKSAAASKQDCVIAPTLFGVFFGMLLKHAFDTTTN